MAETLGTTFYDEMAPHGPRRLLAMALIFLTGLLPLLPALEPGAMALGSPRVAATKSALSAGAIGRAIPANTLMLAAIGGAVGMLLYQPRKGFKLCAVVAGPLIGLGAVWAVQAYLLLRPDVLRFEPLLAAVLGGLPGVVLYAVLARIAYAQQRPELAAA